MNLMKPIRKTKITKSRAAQVARDIHNIIN